MHGGLSREGLKKLEVKIDEQLDGKEASSPYLDQSLKDLIGKYSYEVEYYNLLHKKTPYVNKYGTPTPIKYRVGLSLANFMANGVPVENKETILPDDKHPVTSEIMTSFIKSIESVLQGHPSRQEVEEVLSHDPLLSNFNPK